jgi:hypothetical protein
VRKCSVFWAGLLAATLPSAPALAWGPLTHGIVAQRAFSVLAPQMPWLAPHRDAFIWGAVCADMQEAPDVSATSRERAHATYTVKSIKDQALAEHDRGADAFALGWAAHVGADQAYEVFAASQAGPWLARLTPEATGAATLSEALKNPPLALVEWAVDAALLPRSTGALFDVGRAAAVNLGTPAGAPIAELLNKVLHVDVTAYEAWARLIAGTCLGDGDRYLSERAKTLRIEPWTEMARGAPARQALGDLTPWLTRSVDLAIDNVRLASDTSPNSRVP